MSAETLDHEYSYKTDFEILMENQEFEHQNILVSRPHLDSNSIGKNTTNVTTSHLGSTSIGKKLQIPRH